MTALTKYTKFFKRVLVLLFFVALYCDAPRDNPLDPENPDNHFAQISGTVKTLSIPSTPLSDVNIYWEKDQIMVRTNASGEFAINNILPNKGKLIISKSGFMSDTLEVDWPANNRFNTTITMNAVPCSDSLVLYTIVKNGHGFPLIQQITLNIAAFITDPDNDIDSVYIENSSLNIKKYLKYDPDNGSFQAGFLATELNIRSIRQIVGHTFGLYVKDKFHNTIHIDDGITIRTILDEIVIKSPNANQIVSKTPYLEWDIFNPGFDYHLFIEIYKDEFDRPLIWSKDKIPSDSTLVPVDTVLPEGDYFWWIWCIDPFQNRSRSKPASFTVVH